MKISNFPKEAFDDLSHFVATHYNSSIKVKPMSLKGMNWGKTDFTESHLEFVNDEKIVLDVPFSEIANASVTAKNEVTLEFPPNDASTKRLDNLVEIRFFIPNTLRENTDESGAGKEEDSAEIFCNTLKSLSNLESAQGEVLVSFPEMPCITPRGRFDADLAANYLRLRGKTHDYKILYSSITRLFLLPKSDEIHVFFVIGLEPPLRQGQTRYPYLVFQFAKDDEMELSLNISDEEIQHKFSGRIKKEYNAPVYEVVANVFKGICDKKLLAPSTFKNHSSQPFIKCSVKANEGVLYPLEKCLIFLPKPTLLFNYSDISIVVFSRVSDTSVARTFDMIIRLRNGAEHPFSNISKEEFSFLEEYFGEKGVECKNELADEQTTLHQFDDEDESSPDEDYVEGSDEENQSDLESASDEAMSDEAVSESE